MPFNTVIYSNEIKGNKGLCSYLYVWKLASHLHLYISSHTCNYTNILFIATALNSRCSVWFVHSPFVFNVHNGNVISDQAWGDNDDLLWTSNQTISFTIADTTCKRIKGFGPKNLSPLSQAPMNKIHKNTICCLSPKIWTIVIGWLQIVSKNWSCEQFTSIDLGNNY